MQCVDGYEIQQRVCIAERCEWGDVLVHDAVKNDVGDCAYSGAQGDGNEAEVTPAFHIRPLKPGGEPARAEKNRHSRGSDQQGAHGGVKEPMPGVLARQHEVQRFDINENIGSAKGQKADVLGRNGMNCSAWTEMKGCEGHGKRALTRS